MNIYIQLLRRQRNIYDSNRVLAGHEQAVIGIFRGSSQQAAAHPATVDEKAQVAAAGASQRRWTYHAGNTRNLICVCNLQHLPGYFQSINFGYNVFQAVVAGSLERESPIHDKIESHLGEIG